MSETERETGAKRKTGRKRNSTFPEEFPVLGVFSFCCQKDLKSHLEAQMGTKISPC